MKPIITLFLLISITVNAQQRVHWPNHKKCTIILTYDDALQSQLDTAVPELEAAHLPATFFLTGDIDSRNINRWRRLSKKGI